MKPINCDQFEQTSALALFGELGDHERAEFDAHLATCTECAGRFARLRAAIDAVGALPVEEPSECCRKAILDGARRLHRRSAVGRLRRLVPLAAAAVIAAAVTLWVADEFTRPGPPGPARIASAGQTAWYDDGTGELAVLSDRLQRALVGEGDPVAASDFSMPDLAMSGAIVESLAYELGEDTLANRIDALRCDVALLSTAGSIF